jgi:iron complex transport system substrate-binding protein
MRIVSLVPHATELLFALGAGEELIGVTHECDHPPEVLAIRRMTRDALPAGLDAGEIDAAVRERTLAGESIYVLDEEALSALEPDLIVTQALCPVCAVSYSEVQRLALSIDSRPRVLALDPTSLEEVLADTATVAEAIGRPEQGAALLARLRARIERLGRALADVARPRVVALEWLDPVYAAGHWVPELIALAGGQDPLGRAGEPSATVSWDSVREAQADVLLAMPCGYDAPQALLEAQAQTPTLAHLGARQVFAVDAAAFFSRPGPRLVDGLELLAGILHPDRVPGPGSPAQGPPRAIEVDFLPSGAAGAHRDRDQARRDRNSETARGH